MTSRALEAAVRAVRLWTRVYTCGLPARLRDDRIREIECDLWESTHDGERPPRPLEMLTRLVLGLPHDLSWRVEQSPGASDMNIAPLPQRITVSAFACSFTLHAIALACAAGWISSSPDTTSKARPPQAHTLKGYAPLAAASLAPPDVESPVTPAPPEKDHAMKNAALLIGAMMSAVGLPVAAQQQAREPAFDAATLRPNTSGYNGWRLEPQPGGRLTGTNVPAAALVRFAYDLPDFQIVGGPGWLASTRFDIAAKAEGDPPIEQKRQMLRILLAERFKLTVHTETRELPIYALVLARNDGKPGPQLRRTEADCAREAISVDDWAGVGPATGMPRCGFFGLAPGTDLPKGRGGLAFRGLTLAAFAKRLVPMVRRSVSDRTGLAGYFDGDFDFVAELPPPPPPPGLPSAFSDPFVSVFTVLPEQLGLKLDARRGPVDVLVIDRVEPPGPE